MIKNNPLFLTMFAPHLIEDEPVEADDITPATEEVIDADWRAYDDHDYNTAGECWREETPEWLRCPSDY